MRDVVVKSSQPDLRSAAALSLGLMRDAGSASLLAAELDGRPDSAVSIALLQAIGMSGGKCAIDDVRRIALAADTLSGVRVEAARSLALLGDGAAYDAIAQALPAARGSEETSAWIRALGKLRFERGIAPLTRVLQDDSAPEPVLHAAAVALGDLADRESRSWWSAYAVDHDLQLRSPMLQALLPQ
jgi:HEAT repeat protein